MSVVENVTGKLFQLRVVALKKSVDIFKCVILRCAIVPAFSNWFAASQRQVGRDFV